MQHSKSRWLAPVLLLAPLALNIRAVDGVVLIDQNRALAGNVTPGDAAGFPVTISQAGSYRLSGNLTVPSGQSGIEISASNVTIDLNGFNITTPVQSQVSPARGIFFTGSGPSSITVRNGKIEGFVGPIQIFGAAPFSECLHCTYEDLVLRWGLPDATASFDSWNFTRIHNVTAPDHQIFVKCPSVVTETVARTINVTPNFPGAPPNMGTCAFAHNATF